MPPAPRFPGGAGVFYGPAASPVLDFEGEEAGLPLRHYWWVLRNQWWKILLFATIVTGLTAVVTLRMTPIYEATATLYIDRSEARAVIGQEANAAGAALGDTEGFIRSQIELVQSDAVLRPVVEQFPRNITGAAVGGDRVRIERRVLLVQAGGEQQTRASLGTVQQVHGHAQFAEVP